MQQDKKILRLITIVVATITIALLVFSANYFTKFYKHVNQFEYLTKGPAHE